MSEENLAFSAAEAARLASLNARILGRWRDLIAPTWRSGMYTFRDLVGLRTLSELRSRGVTRQELVRAGRYLSERFETPWSRLKVGLGPKNKVYFWDPDAECWISADDVGQSITPVALDKIGERLKTEVDRSRRRQPAMVGQIVRDRGICGNRPRLAGTRVTVDAIAAELRAGRTSKQILAEFPTLKPGDITAVRKNLAAA